MGDRRAGARPPSPGISVANWVVIEPVRSLAIRKRSGYSALFQTAPRGSFNWQQPRSICPARAIPGRSEYTAKRPL